MQPMDDFNAHVRRAFRNLRAAALREGQMRDGAVKMTLTGLANLAPAKWDGRITLSPSPWFDSRQLPRAALVRVGVELVQL
jgi:hypothetical protein